MTVRLQAWDLLPLARPSHSESENGQWQVLSPSQVTQPAGPGQWLRQTLGPRAQGTAAARASGPRPTSSRPGSISRETEDSDTATGLYFWLGESGNRRRTAGSTPGQELSDFKFKLKTGVTRTVGESGDRWPAGRGTVQGTGSHRRDCEAPSLRLAAPGPAVGLRRDPAAVPVTPWLSLAVPGWY